MDENVATNEPNNCTPNQKLISQEILCNIYYLWRIIGATNDTSPKQIFDTIFTAKGCEFLAGTKGSKDDLLSELEMIYNKVDVVGEKSPEQELIEEEVQKLQLATKPDDYKTRLKRRNDDFLHDKKATLNNAITDFCTNFHISFTTPIAVDISNIQIHPSPGDSYSIFTLFDPFLCYSHKFTQNGTETEWTHQFPLNCIIANACLGIDGLTFRTDEVFNRANACLDSALNSCQIPALSSKEGDCHVITSIPLTNDSLLNHVCLVLEHQRESCSSVWDHKDFAKILLLMRTCLKSSALAGKKRDYFLGPMQTLGILSSRDNVFLLSMETKLLPVSNRDESYGIQYDLSYEQLSSGVYEQREQFIKQLTARLSYIVKQIQPVKKSFKLLTTPKLSSNLLNKNNPQPSILTYEGFLQEPVCNSSAIKDSILDNLLNSKGYRFIRQSILTSDNFSKTTVDRELVTFAQLEKDDITQNQIVLILKIYTNVLIGREYEKISLSVFKEENELEESNGDETYNPAKHGDEISDYNQHSNSNQKRIRKIYESKSKKKKTVASLQNQQVNYSGNLNDITSKFDINGKSVTKVQNNEKVALYFFLPNRFLKIVHYFDNSSENSKGMNIVKSLQHDNINKILHFERLFIKSSQLNELFFENIESKSNTTTCVFITSVELVNDIVLLYMYMRDKDMNTKLLGFIKILLDAIDSVNTLHENNIIHGDISIRNVGILFSKPVQTAYLEEKVQIVNLLTQLPDFNFILLDMNHCKVEGQTTSKTIQVYNHDIDENVFYPFTSDPYCPTKSSIQFTKEHDYYSMAMVLAQLLLCLVYNVSFDELEKWENANLKEIILEQLETRSGQCKNADIMIKLLKETIGNEGNGELFNFKKTFELVNDHLVRTIRNDCYL